MNLVLKCSMFCPAIAVLCTRFIIVTYKEAWYNKKQKTKSYLGGT